MSRPKKAIPVAEVSIERLDPAILECQGVLAAIVQAQQARNMSKRAVRVAQKSRKFREALPDAGFMV